MIVVVLLFMAAAAIAAANWYFVELSSRGPSVTSDAPADAQEGPLFLQQACTLPPEWVTLTDRGWMPGGPRDDDIIIIPNPPNYIGGFINTSHSGPYDFLQDVPLVFYGRGYVDPQGHVDLGRETTLADLAPTYAQLMDFDFPRREGRPVEGIWRDNREPPALIVTGVIDGGGWNVLNRWPDAWPNLAKLIERGANIDGAIVGSSPSVTPATHTNLSTGTFPRRHGATAILVRGDDGSITGAFSQDERYAGPDVDPGVSLRVTTLADLWDRANSNEPLAGMLSSFSYPLGMIGRGAAIRGGDHDIVVIEDEGVWATDPEFYSMPEYLNTEVAGPEQDVQEVDLRDGVDDELWRGHEIAPLDATPAFAPWQTRTITELFAREGFGADDLTDLFYINYKSPDEAGHKWNMIGPEQSDVLISVDDAIGDLVKWLDETVGRDRYLLVLTADHGQTPLEAGGWPINRNELLADLAREFDDHINHNGIIDDTTATVLYSDVTEMKRNGVTPEEVSSFLSTYTIGDNIAEDADVPEEFRDRVDELIFRGVFPGRALPEIMECTGARP
ncbi:MAG: alkaline phosphatase family protein [Actinomycetota bacterium]